MCLTFTAMIWTGVSRMLLMGMIGNFIAYITHLPPALLIRFEIIYVLGWNNWFQILASLVPLSCGRFGVLAINVSFRISSILSKKLTLKCYYLCIISWKHLLMLSLTMFSSMQLACILSCVYSTGKRRFKVARFSKSMTGRCWVWRILRVFDISHSSTGVGSCQHLGGNWRAVNLIKKLVSSVQTHREYAGLVEGIQFLAV